MSVGDAELIEPDGDGAELFDDPTVFYLTYREDIERWHALKERANQAVHHYFLGLRQDIEAIAEREAMAVEMFKTGSRYRSLLLWPAAADTLDDGQPPIAIGLRWPRKQPALDEGGHAPRVGVRVARDQELLRERFLSTGEPDVRRLRDQHGYQSDKRWPAFRTVPGDPGWWADLDGYRGTLLDALEGALSHFGDRIRTAYPGE